jgi:hypothetical protein
MDVCLVGVVCCHVEVSASGWLLVQRSPIECSVSECDCEVSVMRMHWPTRVCRTIKKVLLKIHAMPCSVLWSRWVETLFNDCCCLNIKQCQGELVPCASVACLSNQHPHQTAVSPHKLVLYGTNRFPLIVVSSRDHKGQWVWIPIALLMYNPIVYLTCVSKGLAMS